LLPTWHGERNPSARDIAVAAGERGASFTLVTGITTLDGQLENTLAAPHAVIASEKFPRQEPVFMGAGDTLSAAMAAKLASDCDLPQAFSDALRHLDSALASGFRPGMGNHLPDRLYWAPAENAAPQLAANLTPNTTEDSAHSFTPQEPNTHDTPH
jgi:hydroxymethylpyrimidine/phosphomethylpyrimidine kinase